MRQSRIDQVANVCQIDGCCEDDLGSCHDYFGTDSSMNTDSDMDGEDGN